MSELTPFDVAKQILEEFIFITSSKSDELFIYKEGVYLKQGDSIIKKRVQEILQDKATTHKVNEVINHIKRMTIKDIDEDENPINLICVVNGILNIDTKELKEHSPNVIFFSKLPVKYCRDVKYDLFDRFVKELVNEKSAMILQEFVGYCLRRDTAYQKALILKGTGNNGKSTLLKILEELFGKGNCSAIPLQQLEEDKFITADLKGKIANIFADLPERALSETSIVKSIITGDTITVQHKFGHPFSQIPTVKLMFSCNKLPKTKDYSNGFFRRWIIIEFNSIFKENVKPNKERDFIDEESLSGILNWALKGLDRLKDWGGFMVSEKETRDLWMRNSDNIAAFIQDKLEVDENNHMPKEEVYNQYVTYCKNNNKIPLENNAFHRELAEKIEIKSFQPSLNGKQIHAWKGIKFKENIVW